MTQYEKAYQFYSQLKNLKKNIKDARNELRLMREAAVNDQYGGGVSIGTPSGKNERNKVENGVVKTMALEEKIAELAKRYEEIRFEIERAIECLTNLNERTVLKMRYLYFKRFEDIVVMTGYSISHVYRFHRNGLKNTVLTEV